VKSCGMEKQSRTSRFFSMMPDVYRDQGKNYARIWREGMTASMVLHGCKRTDRLVIMMSKKCDGCEYLIQRKLVTGGYFDECVLTGSIVFDEPYEPCPLELAANKHG